MATTTHSTAPAGTGDGPQGGLLEPTALLSRGLARWGLNAVCQAGEATLWLVPGDGGLPSDPEAERAQRTPEEVQEACALRAKGEIRRHLRANRADHLWTFTCARAVYSYEDVARLADQFLRRKAAAGDRGYFLLVAEPHPGGHGWHLHGATNRYIDVGRVRHWWAAGFVKVVGPRGRRGRAWSSRRLAGYLSKYVAKGLRAEELHGCTPRPKGAHRYWVTQGYEPVTTTRYFDSLGYAMAWLRRNVGRPEGMVPFGLDDPLRPEGYWVSFRESDWHPAPLGLERSRGPTP